MKRRCLLWARIGPFQFGTPANTGMAVLPRSAGVGAGRRNGSNSNHPARTVIMDAESVDGSGTADEEVSERKIQNGESELTILQ